MTEQEDNFVSLEEATRLAVELLEHHGSMESEKAHEYLEALVGHVRGMRADAALLQLWEQKKVRFSWDGTDLYVSLKHEGGNA